MGAQITFNKPTLYPYKFLADTDLTPAAVYGGTNVRLKAKKFLKDQVVYGYRVEPQNCSDCETIYFEYEGIGYEAPDSVWNHPLQPVNEPGGIIFTKEDLNKAKSANRTIFPPLLAGIGTGLLIGGGIKKNKTVMITGGIMIVVAILLRAKGA